MSAPPLIAHIIYCLSTGGLENGLVNILNRSPAQRYRHIIICITTADDFAQRITADNVEVIQLHKRAGHDMDFYVRLWKLLRELRPDIIHSRNLAALETQLCSVGLKGVRRVHGEHGREITDLDGTNWKYLNFRRFMRLFIHRYIAVSRDLQQWLLEKVRVSPQKARQIYNGVDQQRFTPGTVKPLALLPAHWQDHGDILVLGTVGRLTPVKDQQLLLRALAHLRSEQPDETAHLRLVIAGDGPLRDALAQQARQLGLDSVVWLAGDRKDVPAILSALDIFVLPSLAEGISNTVLEAMASGLPVVATAAGGNVELVEQGFNGALFPVGDHIALASVLWDLLSNESKRIEQGVNARQRISEQFDWNRTVNSYLEVYDELLGRDTAHLSNGAT